MNLVTHTELGTISKKHFQRWNLQTESVTKNNLVFLSVHIGNIFIIPSAQFSHSRFLYCDFENFEKHRFYENYDVKFRTVANSVLRVTQPFGL